MDNDEDIRRQAADLKNQIDMGIELARKRREELLGSRPVGTRQDSAGGGEPDSEDRTANNGMVAALNNNRGPGPETEDVSDAHAYAVRSKLSQEHRDHVAARWFMISVVAAVVMFVILMALPFLKREWKAKHDGVYPAPNAVPTRKIVVVSPIPVQVTPPKEFAGDSLLVGKKIYHSTVGDVGKPTDPIESPDAGSAARLYVRSVGEKQMIGTFVIQARNAPDQPWMSVGAVVNPPVKTWQKLGGPIFPFMRFELTNMAQGDGVEVDLCSGECPDPHEVWVQK